MTSSQADSASEENEKDSQFDGIAHGSKSAATSSPYRINAKRDSHRVGVDSVALRLGFIRPNFLNLPWNERNDRSLSPMTRRLIHEIYVVNRVSCNSCRYFQLNLLKSWNRGDRKSPR